MNKNSGTRKMLGFHSAYTFEYIKEYGLEIFVQARDASNFFSDILTVSPIASLQYPLGDKRFYSKPEFFRLDSKNTILEGRIARFRLLRIIPMLNFFCAQIGLLLAILKKAHLREIVLVRSEDPRLNGLYGFIFAKLLRKPFVVGVWGNPGRLRELNQTPNMPRLFPTMKSEELLEKFILRRADAVLVQNFENLQYVLKCGVDEAKCHYTELGVGIDKSHFLPNSERSDVTADLAALGVNDELILVCISRLEKLKMVDNAILASKVLLNADINFKLLLIGDGRELENLKLLASSEGLGNRVIFCGNRSQEWISGALKSSHINVAPLCGRSLLEASLAGLPAAAYEVDWHSEIVKNGVTGFLVPNLDYFALGEALTTLCRDATLRARFKQNMLKAAIQFADPLQIAKRQRGIYESLTNENI